jgi:hypothetical protein
MMRAVRIVGQNLAKSAGWREQRHREKRKECQGSFHDTDPF